MKSIDTHCHLNINKHLNNDRLIMINVGTDEESLIENRDFWSKEQYIYNTIGIHPCDISFFKNNNISSLKIFINKKTVAIGEVGLDYFHPPFIKEEQAKYFIEQINLANELSLPVVVHSRESMHDTFDILKNFKSTKFLLHSWSGNIEETKKYLSLGDNIYFSYNGILTFKNAKIQKESIVHIPLNRLMFETDSPYLSPEPFRGQVNIPSRVINVIDYASKLLGKSFNEINHNNNLVSIDFFNLDKDIFNEG